MKRLFLLIFSFLVFDACSKVKVVSPGPAGEELADMKKGAEIVQVNNAVIREGYLEMLSAINPRVKSQISNPAMKKKVVESLVDQELLYQESVQRGLDRKKEVADKAALYKRIIIAQALMEEEMDKKTREYYEQHKDADFTRVAISHIQIDFKKPEPETPETSGEKGETKDKKAKEKGPATEAEKKEALDRTKTVKARLTAGEDFAKVAEETTNDNASKKKGGDLGKISRDDKRLARRGLEKLVDAAFSLKMGQVSEVIETPKAYHIIKVTSEPEVTPFEEAKKTIEFQLQKQVKEELLAKLKQAAKIVYAVEPASTSPKNPEAPPQEGASSGVAPKAPASPPSTTGDSEPVMAPGTPTVPGETETPKTTGPEGAPSGTPPPADTGVTSPEAPEPPPPMAVPAEKKGT
ncbi:MAG: peptidylprolyl isomerase [Deltaproteobacteria bacterium]|nr:peptidylprolyl isomerase [Deltaproteobacteria bacterium]